MCLRERRPEPWTLLLLWGGCPWLLSCAGVPDAVAMIGGILLASSLPRFFSRPLIKTFAVHLPQRLAEPSNPTSDTRRHELPLRTRLPVHVSSCCAAAHCLDICPAKKGRAGFCRRTSVLSASQQESRMFLESSLVLFSPPLRERVAVKHRRKKKAKKLKDSSLLKYKLHVFSITVLQQFYQTPD